MFDRNKGKVPAAIPRFLDRLEEVALSVLQLSQALQGNPLPKVLRADAGAVPLKENSVDAIVTHPPYIGSIPYAEYGQLSITWLGHDSKQLDRKLTGGRRQSNTVVEQFRAGYDRMLSEAHRVLRPGRLLLLLVGNPLVKGARIDLTQMSKDLAVNNGFQLTAKSKRNSVNRRANLMGQEALLLFEKL
jgi:tRNA G10  N-methylase Trm11